MYDLIVIGGGPAGTSAAITAAQAGASVLLFERGRFPRHKVCGEFVSAESLALLTALLSKTASELLQSRPRIDRSRMFIDEHVLRAPIDPPAASISRHDLDAALWRAALDSGAETRDQTTVQAVSGRGPFQITSPGGPLQGRAVIDATGRRSNLSVRQGHDNNSKGKWIGLKAHFSELSPAQSVDLYFFSGGYCGVQPIGVSQVNVCAMVRADIASRLEAVFAQNPALLERSSGWRPLTQPIGTSQLVFREPQPVRDGILLAGDAAGFVDPFVGDGISLALRSGALAANSLIASFRAEVTLEQSCVAYQEQYQKQLAPVFRAATRIRRILQMPQPVRKPIYAVLKKAPALAAYLVRATR